MNVPLFLGTTALVLAGLGTAVYFVSKDSAPVDPELLALAREIRSLETAKPEPETERLATERVRDWTRDARDAEFTAPAVVAELAWFTSGAAQGVGRTVARSAHAVRLGKAEDPIHFWYLRNAVDPARMDGVEVRHEERALVEYPETDLQDVGLGSSWAALSQFGVELDAFAALQRTGEAETAFATRFERWVRTATTPPAADEVLELWWSEELRVPLRVLRARGEANLEQRLIALERRLDPDLHRVPALHWPEYQVMDVADYREGLHDHPTAAPSAADPHAHHDH